MPGRQRSRSNPTPTPNPRPNPGVPDTGVRPTPNPGPSGGGVTFPAGQTPAAGSGSPAPPDTSGGGLVGQATDAVKDAAGNAADGLLGGLADTIKEAFSPLIAVGKLGEKITGLFMPTSLMRAACGIAGVFFIGLAIFLLGRELKHAVV